MAKCSDCGNDMSAETTVTCSLVPITFPDGSQKPAILWPGPGRCPDCNIAPGGQHHPGCDMERCPVCGGQLIGCECLDSEEE